PVAHGGEASALRGRLAGVVLAAEEAAGEREERQEAEAHALALGEDAGLGLAVEDVVLVLDAHEPRPTLGRGGGRLFEQLWGEVRAAELANLALGDEVGQRADGLRERCLGV